LVFCKFNSKEKRLRLTLKQLETKFSKLSECFGFPHYIGLTKLISRLLWQPRQQEMFVLMATTKIVVLVDELRNGISMA
jgi:hypothetical protein